MPCIGDADVASEERAMLDYHATAIGLDTFRAALDSAFFIDPAMEDARARADAAADAHPTAALLGAFVHHLVGLAASDGAELQLLRDGAALWADGRALFAEVARIRQELEDVLADPANPGNAARFDAAALSGQELANVAISLRDRVDAYRAQVLDFTHLPPHPRQEDRRSDDWDWPSLIAGRRTDAFVQALFDAATTDQTLGFAVGAASAYGSHAVGSSYLGHAVGGPRRSQRYRERLARNSIGTWFTRHDPRARSIASLADELDAAGAIDADIADQLRRALEAAYGNGPTPPLPDASLGVDRLREHLRLLDSFGLPDAPAVPSVYWMSRLYSDPSSPPPSLTPQDVDVVGQDGGGTAVTMGPEPSPGTTTSGDSDSSKTSKGCGIAILAIILVDLFQALVRCLVQLADGDTCTFWQNMLLSKLFEQDPPDPRDPTHTTTSELGLANIAASTEVVEFVGILFETHTQAYEAMARAREFLTLTGLLYPLDVDALPLYRQFTALPATNREAWPHREPDEMVDAFHLAPTSALEHPTERASAYPTGASPAVIFDATSPAPAATVALTAWARIAIGGAPVANLDLDADRAFLHPCWETLDSTRDDPIGVRVLDYDEQ